MNPRVAMIQTSRRTPTRHAQVTPDRQSLASLLNRSSTIPAACMILAGVTLALAFRTLDACAAENLKTESRIPYLHHIPLRDADGQIITLPPPFDEQGKPQDARANPF